MKYNRKEYLPFKVGNSGGEKWDAKWGGKNSADEVLAVEFEWSNIGLKLAELK